MIRKKIVKDLIKIVGKVDVLTEKEDLVAYSYDGTTSWVHEPDVVVFPTSAREISKILKLADKERIAVTPRGAGTNVSGGSIPIQGGIVLCSKEYIDIVNKGCPLVLGGPLPHVIAAKAIAFREANTPEFCR